MKNTVKKISAISAIAAFSITNFANAATVPISGNTSSAQSVEICKTITNAYDPTTATFNYSFTAKTSGLTGLPTGQSIVFNNAAHTNNTVKKCIDVDISGVTFSDSTPKQIEVEVAESTTSDITADSQKYTLLFDLRNAVDGSSNITGQLASLAYIKNEDGQKQENLSFSSAREYDSKSIVISKTVKGTAGDTNKFFKFTVNIAGAAGTTYTVNGAAAGSGSATSCAANTNCIVYVKHGDSIRIGYNGTSSQIPVGTTYTVSEESVSGYTTTVAVGSAAATTSNTTGQQEVSSTNANNTVSFTNTKNAEVITGIFLNLWPYILLGAISVGAVIYIKKSYAEKK